LKSKILILIFLVVASNLILAQTIQCKFPPLQGTKVKFGTFEGLNSKILDSMVVDATGNFNFQFTTEKPSIGYLITAENKPYFLILDKEDIELSGGFLTDASTINILAGKQNQAFAQYASEHPKREQAISAWKYLDQIYTLDPLFSKEISAKKLIVEQYAKIKHEDRVFLDGLPKDSYVAWYLPVRRLVSDVPIIAQYRPEEIPATIRAFRMLDYTDDRLYRSGLFKEAIESHYWLLENCGKSLDSVFIEMKVSIDSMMTKLVTNEKKLNEVSDYLFDLLERHSLFQASEYLALKVLNEVSCTINSDLAKQLETYRAMKKGNIAPDIMFRAEILSGSGKKAPSKLSEMTSPYIVVVFGAGWCEKCRNELPKITNLYSKWQTQGVEVVFISLDETQKDFKSFAGAFPFISYCDYKKWESTVAKDYYIFGTPTMFLLDNKREILLRPNSVEQMDAWVDWFLVQGNQHPK
jgi:thiol-disulfide isomerase/thioredoxin